ncbi:conserved domain protein [delta proteobacterium NaphS2]|nr:conserved domain protein [delta proteobacterium NaphS2]
MTVLEGGHILYLCRREGQGYAVCDRELSLEVTSIAFPVLEAAGKVVAAVNVMRVMPKE